MDGVADRGLRRWALASLVANIGIVLTGGLVRLTGSGLGCPTWPQCEPGSYVPRAAAAWNAYVEFGNRLLTFVLLAVAVGTLWASWRRTTSGAPRRLARGLSVGIIVGIFAQAVIGGISVWLQLNPWVVGLHMVVSVALIVTCTALVHDAFGLKPAAVPLGWVRLTRAIFALAMAALYLGTVVTGAGPLAGDGGAQRNGLTEEATARAHSLTVWLMVALTVTLAVLARRHPRVRRAAYGVLGVAALEGAVGYSQYLTHLPVLLVLGHLLGASLFTVAVTHLRLGVRTSDQNSSGSTAAAMNTIAK